MAEMCKKCKKLAKIRDLGIKVIKYFLSHPLGPDASFYFFFHLESPLNWPKPLKMAKICPKKVRIPHFLVVRRPTTDLFHVFACTHGRCLVT